MQRRPRSASPSADRILLRREASALLGYPARSWASPGHGLHPGSCPALQFRSIEVNREAPSPAPIRGAVCSPPPTGSLGLPC